MTRWDAIVVGSGPGGVHAASALVEAGRRVLMLDYGNPPYRYQDRVPRRAFTELRRTDAEQHRYLLGDELEGIPLGPVRVGAQLTPPRQPTLADAGERLPIEGEGFTASQSLALGGLGAAWSAGVFPFDDGELAATGLGVAELQPHYDAVSERIGVARAADDLSRFFPESPSRLRPLGVDSAAEAILERYRRQRAAHAGRGFFLGRPPLAVCTERHRGRGPHEELDLDYWVDFDRAVYRPQWTLEELGSAPGFRYLGRRWVERFVESPSGVRVEASHADEGRSEAHEADALVLAAGAFGSARIALRSLDRYGVSVPLLANPYAYVATLNLGSLGPGWRDRRHSLAQLSAILETGDGRRVQAQVFSYRSLLTFKLLGESPLGFRDALQVQRLLLPHLSILGVHHEDRPSPGKTATLRRAGDGRPDRFEVDYRPSDEEERRQRSDERALRRAFRRLGCVALRTVRPGHGASIHYGGTLPMLPDGGELTCTTEGRLRATRRVHVADGALFPWLPAKGCTFTLMAMADRVGSRLARRLGSAKEAP